MSDRVTGSLLLLGAIAYGWEASRFEAGALTGPVGPGAFPLLLAVLLGVFASTLLVRPDPNPDAPTAALWFRGGTVVASTVAYAYLLVPLGFVLATTAEFVLIGTFFGGRPVRTLLLGAAITVATFLLFDAVLGLPLPTGPFGG